MLTYDEKIEEIYQCTIAKQRFYIDDNMADAMGHSRDMIAFIASVTEDDLPKYVANKTWLENLWVKRAENVYYLDNGQNYNPMLPYVEAIPYTYEEIVTEQETVKATL